MWFIARGLAPVALVVGLGAVPSHVTPRVATTPDFVHFESGHVHPAVMTPDGTKLLVVNTSDNRLSVFDLTGDVPVRTAEIPVGMEPVSVAARNDGEAWVVNNLSDDVSVVNLVSQNVRATLRVGDEPTDVVFAGPLGRAYVCVSQEDAVKVYDPADLSAAPTVIPIPARTPRALARSLDGAEVFVSVFHASGQTTTLSTEEAGDSLPPPVPAMSPSLPPRPRTGLMVRFDGTNWIDSAGHLWNSKIPYSVPAVEVVALSAVTNTVIATRGGIATSMMGAAINPVTGAAAWTGQAAARDVQLEPNLRGKLSEERLAIFPTFATPPTVVSLNPHIAYAVLPAPQSEIDSSLAFPTGVCWSADGQRVYVTSLGNNRLGVLNSSGTMLARVPTIAGPTGVIADPLRPRLYVVGRFHNQLQTLSTSSLASEAIASIGFDPTPDPIVNGRRIFYGGFTSGHGDQACATCHLFGDFDNLAWDLGNPLGAMSPIPPGQIDLLLAPSHPLKGPMVTQSLRGLPGTGVLHWRGDRDDFAAFNGAFVSLMGLDVMLPDTEMTALADFVLPLVYPPNPSQNLDRTPPDAPAGQPSAKRGRDLFFGISGGTNIRCIDCHQLPNGTSGEVLNRFLLGEVQDMKIPQLRNLYKKTGFRDSAGVVNKRGSGYMHDGAVDNLFGLVGTHFPNFSGPVETVDGQRRDLERYLLTFDTGMAPAVGSQLTFDGTNNGSMTLLARLDTLEARAAAGECDLIAKGRVGNLPRGFLYAGGGDWSSDLAGMSPLSRTALLALVSAGHELTVTGVPPGSGSRMGIDRDRDGFRDGDELAAGSDPGDPLSTPVTDVAPPVAGFQGVRSIGPNPFVSELTITFALSRPGRVSVTVYDLLGREVRAVVHDQLVPAGSHSVGWDGRGATGISMRAGVYFVRLGIGAERWQRMVVRLR